ncbi:class I SAM-dependent methyltransferase [Rivibacter subsaxonicus]|uniref:Methyltransferase family protein n=1 Tax=Rivibacter subsaxonicus TaxID=457575 RepID=A0A4Q7VZC5_9BURK|nr:class I SAM-dependent methyltransferase [Rivibacter subsaxonicus]RZU02242.1 methyltransferase family protein [Rivibacter subsaxonicus]
MNALSDTISRQAQPQAAAVEPDFAAVKTRQRAAWSSGDYAVVGTTLQIVGETLCEALDLRAGANVLDVAAGNGNASLAAARRGCNVVSTDYVPALLTRGRERAAAERLDIEFREADVEALPFDDDAFDAVLSTFGAMFAPNPRRTAAEMLRVCAPGGRIGMANWTPESFVGQLFKTIGRHVRPPAGIESPALWGTRKRIEELFGTRAAAIRCESRRFNFRYRSPQEMVDVFRNYYGPVLKAFGALEPAAQATLSEELLALIGRFNRAEDGTVVLPSEYLEIVITTTQNTPR